MLHHSLKQNKTKYPLVALYTDSFPAEGHEALKRRGIPERRIDYIRPSLEKDYGNDPRFQETWTKLTIFSLVEFERVVLLDSDMLVLKNLDELMDVELDPPSMNGDGDRVYAASHACVCNPMKKPHYPKDWYVGELFELPSRFLCLVPHIERLYAEAASGFQLNVLSEHSIRYLTLHRLRATPI